MIKFKKYLLNLIHIFSVILASLTLFAVVAFNTAKEVNAEINTGYTGFIPYRNKSEETVYHLFKTQLSELTPGKEIMFVGGTGLENTMVVPQIPAGSATLRVTASGKAYIKESLTCYVDVIERGNGFDWCESGTLNFNATEYSCSYSGVQHYKGAAFNYATKTYYNTATVGVFQNNTAVTNAKVQLYDGEGYFTLNSQGNGYYSNTKIFNGGYEIVVNDEHTGQPLIIDKFTIGENGRLEGDIFYSGNTYSENVYFYTMEVKTYLDGNLSNEPGSVYLKSACTNCALSRKSTGTYSVRYIMKESSVREAYSVIIGGQDTGYKLNDFKNSSFTNSVSIYYYTLKVNITADSPWTNARVELRNDNGEVCSVLNYKSTNGNTTSYTNIMQKDEATNPEKMTVYVDYVSADKEIYAVRNGAMGSEGDKTFADIVYYDIRVNLKLDNNAFTLKYPVTISNGMYSYSLTNENGTLSMRVRQVKVNDEELPYVVSVAGVTDNLEPLSLTKGNPEITYNYYTVNYYTYKVNGTNATASVYRTQYVRSGSVPSMVSDPYVSGMTFDKWSLTTWNQSEDLDSIAEYNFANPITAKTNIYPHFAKTEVKINDSFVKCSVSGNQSSTGVAFRMANVTITGFEKGNNSIKSILLNLTNVETAYFYSTSGKTYKQGQNANLTSVSGGYSANQSAVCIIFNNKVSMAEAQDYIRNYVVIKPVVNQDVQVTLTVSDGVLSTSSTTSISQAEWNGTAWTTKAAGTYNSWSIGSGNGTQYVYFTGNCTFNGTSSNKSGLQISGTCYIYIPTGVTVTCNGYAGSGQTGGGAGVYLPSGATLYVLGNGTLVANGGKAGNGSNGANGGGGWKSGSTYGSGSGGNGGAGGGGAGAGIGTNGANGGNGGNGGAGGSVGWSSKGKAQFWGKAGSAGGTGGSPAAAGTLYKTSSVTIRATGGAKGNNGSGGSAGGYQTDSGTGWKYNHCAAGGGGGGAGAGGYAANNIGAGGAGGGGGGGGGSGACDYHSNTDYNCIGGGKGGYGGYGANGQAGRGGNAHCDHQDVPGGNGGGAGSGGTAGASKSATNFSISTSSNTQWTVTFNGATSNGTQYYSFNSTSIVVPDYVPTGKNLFLGWKVKTYAKNTYGGSASRPLTTNENVLYQPGETITTALGTYGNIVLEAITMPYEGKIAQDKLNVAKKYFASSSPTNPTYYTYTVQTYLDNVKSTVGTMVFTINGKNYKVESSASNPGLYSLTLETNVNTFTAKIDGVAVQGTLSKNTTNNVYFESMNVKITGHNNVQSVLLDGASAPVLKYDELQSSGLTTVYSSIKQKGLDSNTYSISVNGKAVPTETAVAKYGTTALIEYSTVFVSLNTNMNIETVELIDENKNSIPLVYLNNKWSATEVLDENTVYSVYANGFDTKVTAKFDTDGVEKTAKIYEFKLVTRINGEITSSIAKLTVNNRATTMKTETLSTTKKGPAEEIEYWSYVVVDDEEVTIESNGTEVTTIKPNENLDNTYIDYYTVVYQTGDAVGDAPVDENIYLAGDSATVLSYNHLSTSNQNSYLSGWELENAAYGEGDTAVVNGPLVFTAICSSDLLKVHYVDHFRELEVKSQYGLTDKLYAYEGDKAITLFNEYGRTYTLIGWVLNIDDSQTIYETATVTDFVAGDILGDSEEEVNVYFTAVYKVKYLTDIHFELAFDEENDDDQDGVIITGLVGEKFTVNYKVTVNSGVNALLLIPEYNKDVFKINSVTATSLTALGEPTLSENYGVDVFKIAFENTDIYGTTGDILISIEYEIINNVAGKYDEFGFVLDYPENTLPQVDNLTRSNAWLIISEPDHSAFHNEVQIFVDNKVSVIIQTAGEIIIEEQTVVYHGEALTAGDIYSLATEFDSEETYYEFAAGEFVVNENVTEENFDENYYYTLNKVDDVLFAYSGFGQQVYCKNPAQFTIKWYTLDGEEYTEIEAPKYVGDYYIGVASSTSDYVYSVLEVRQLIHIIQAEVTYTIHDKTSAWNDALQTLTGEVTEGEVYEGDDLNIVLSTTATSDSVAGEYPITATFNNENYIVTFENGTYTITKKQIELGKDATAKFNDGSFAYDGTEKTISATINEFYQNILSVSYTGGEQGCSGNGAIRVKFNDEEEITGYLITATFTINSDYVNKVEFVKDNDDQYINTLQATLTITISSLTQQEVDDLVSKFVEFSVVDGETSHKLTPNENNQMSYNKTYDAIFEYAKVIISGENTNGTNDKLSQVVTYKLNDLESVQFEATEDYDYSPYNVMNAGTYIVKITIAPGYGYSFDVDVNPVYEITMTIAKQGLTINATAEVDYSDETPVITIDNGTNSWVAEENYAVYDITDIQSYTDLLETSYEQGDTAGSEYTINWKTDAKATLEAMLINYELTLTVDDNLTVNKKVIDADQYEFEGYSAVYDGQEHELIVLRNGEQLAKNDTLVAYTISHNDVEKSVVKHVAESGDYVATIELCDKDNYIFAINEEYWTLNANSTVANVTKAVEIGPKALNIEVEYTKSTAQFSVSGFVTGEDATYLTEFTYLLDSVACSNKMTATTAGDFELTAQNSNTDYSFTKYTLTVYEVSFAYGSYEETIAGSGYVPQNMPASQFVFAGLDAATFEEAEKTGLFTADLPVEVPTLRHYTFTNWSGTAGGSEFNFAETIIDKNTTIYAVWQENPTYQITYKYRVDNETTWNDYKVDTFYTDDLLVYGDTLRTLDVTSWFKGNVWYYDQALTNKVLNKIYFNTNTTLYGHYRFDIGTGDVNADGYVNANDITLYREWIVGGYEMEVIEKGNEWATVTANDFDPTKTYFLKRVADSNAPQSSSVVLGDQSLDIRDVSTIRMGLVGGYGFDITTGVEVTNDSLVIISVSEIDNISKLLLGVASGMKSKLSKDIKESAAIVDVTDLLRDVVIDLNGKTITVPSFSLALASNYDGKIEIYNGSIVAENGISLTAPSGTIILNNVTLYDKDGKFTLQAAGNSLHFEGDVKFLKDGGNNNQVAANVVIPSTTHVVLEAGSSLTIKNIVVEQVEGHTLSIEINNTQEELLAVQGEYEATGKNTEAIKPFDTVTTVYELLDAAANGFDICLGADITLTSTLAYTASATIDLNGKTITKSTGYAITAAGEGVVLTIKGNGTINTSARVASADNKAQIIVENGTFVSGDVAFTATNGATLTFNGGNVTAQEACLMAFYGSKLNVVDGTFTSKDNFVVGTNGSEGQGLNTITINGGTFNGGIITSGYVACGIYVANNDTVVVNGGTFNITNGVGILARSGNTTINSDVEFAVTGDGHLGKVGDSQVTVPSGQNLVLDYKADYPGGSPIINNNTTNSVYVVVDGTYTFAYDDSSFHAARGVYDNVILSADLSDYLYVTKDMNIYLNGHTVDASTTPYVAIYVVNEAKVTINGEGNVIGTEGCVIAFDGSEFTINGGTYTSLDNFVFGTNGSEGEGNNKITINDGTFNGSIKSEGYIACGIYVANSDTVVVNGGTFNIENGVGILARSGNTTVNANATFDVEGTIAGKVGDSQVAIPAGNVLVVDYAANYPGGTPTLTNNTNYGVYALVDDEASLNAAALYADTVVLGADIELTAEVIITRDMTLELNGHKLFNDTVEIWSDDYWALIAVAGANLTINGEGQLLAKENDCYAIELYGNGNLVINGGTYAGNCHSIYVLKGTLTVNGGYFYVQQPSENPDPYGYVLNCLDARYQAGVAHIIVNGGQFENFNPADCAAEGAKTNFVSVGHTVTSEEVNNKTIYTVVTEE